jgi:hypothetical protein
MEYGYDINICLVSRDSKLDCSQGKGGVSPRDIGATWAGHEDVGSQKNPVRVRKSAGRACCYPPSG